MVLVRLGDWGLGEEIDRFSGFGIFRWIKNTRLLNYYEQIFQEIISFLTWSIDMTGTTMPPQNITVPIVTMQVVEKNICRTSVTVFLMDKAKAIAPRSPENQSMCWN